MPAGGELEGIPTQLAEVDGDGVLLVFWTSVFLYGGAERMCASPWAATEKFMS